jgi:3-deoxy-D-manno-octulosonic-acid transferase
MRLIYTLFIHLYSLAAWLSARFNRKAEKWVSGRKNQFESLQLKAGKSDQWLWFHASSLGEFEQGRPVIEAIKGGYPDYSILLTFFSPSGFEIRKNYEYADCVAYLPADTPAHAQKLVGMFRPKAAFFIKYEFWFNYMQALRKNEIPLYFISARFRKNQHFFKPYGFWFRKQLKQVTHFFVQDEASAQLLASIDIKDTTITGDTRFDRVAMLPSTAKPFPEVVHFKGNRKLIIAGSTWPPDEKILSGLVASLPEDWAMILAPHDVSEGHVSGLSKSISVPYQLHSLYDQNIACKVLAINSIGILSQLYQYADFVYIGGGFGQSIHNIQEPVTFGCPVIFGPRHQKFSEAVDLIRLGGAFTVNNQEQLREVAQKLMQDDTYRNKCSSVCTSYVARQTGATEKIMEHLRQHLFLS